MSARTSTKTTSLDERLAALNDALSVAVDRLPDGDVEPASAIRDRAGERLALGVDLTVVALAGATGSGKSSLFNALSGEDLSKVGVRRPTTGTAHACVWGGGTSERLLDWLDVPRRHHLEDADLDGLVLLDLPDHDSTQSDHRAEVDRLIQRVDLFIWVVDPQKYADAALHERYLRPLASYAGVTLVVLNQIDRLSDAEVKRCLQDLQRLLDDDGLTSAQVLGVSARTGAGMSELRAAIEERVREQHAAAERLGADLAGVADRWAPYCAGSRKSDGPNKNEVARLVAALGRAAGVETVGAAVERSHRRDAGLVVGWPFTRWLRKLRPDPLRRLHLGEGTSGGRTSLPAASPVEKAQIENALRAAAGASSEDLPYPWPDRIRERATSHHKPLVDELDHAISQADLGETRRPNWWTVAGALQSILAVIAVAGFLWLAGLFALGWLRVPLPPTPEVEEIPVPTIALIGGLLAGLLLAAIFRRFASVGARRRRRRAERRLRAAVEEVTEAHVLDPIRDELAAHRRFCSAVDRLT